MAAIGRNWQDIWGPVWASVWAPVVGPEDPIGINWSPIWKQVWGPVWQTEEGPGTEYTLTCDAGAFVLAGAGAYSSRVMPLDTGAFALAGQDAGFTYNPVAQDYTLTCDPGSFVLSGQAATFPRDYVLHAATGAFTFTGNDTYVPPGTQASAGGRNRRPKYVAYINGKRHVGESDYIQRVIEEFAETQAQKTVTKAKKLAKPRIVIRDKPIKGQEKPTAEAIEAVQEQANDWYAEAYRDSVAEYQAEIDDEEALLHML